MKLIAVLLLAAALMIMPMCILGLADDYKQLHDRFLIGELSQEQLHDHYLKGQLTEEEYNDAARKLELVNNSIDEGYKWFEAGQENDTGTYTQKASDCYLRAYGCFYNASRYDPDDYRGWYWSARIQYLMANWFAESSKNRSPKTTNLLAQGYSSAGTGYYKALEVCKDPQICKQIKYEMNVCQNKSDELSLISIPTS